MVSFRHLTATIGTIYCGNAIGVLALWTNPLCANHIRSLLFLLFESRALAARRMQYSFRSPHLAEAARNRCRRFVVFKFRGHYEGVFLNLTKNSRSQCKSTQPSRSNCAFRTRTRIGEPRARGIWKFMYQPNAMTRSSGLLCQLPAMYLPEFVWWQFPVIAINRETIDLSITLRRIHYHLKVQLKRCENCVNVLNFK